MGIKYVETAIEIYLDRNKSNPAMAIHILSKWGNSYVLYFKNDNINNEPVRLLPINSERKTQEFEYRMMKKNILSIAKECKDIIERSC